MSSHEQIESDFQFARRLQEEEYTTMSQESAHPFFTPSRRGMDIPFDVYETVIGGLPGEFAQFLPPGMFPEPPRSTFSEIPERERSDRLPSFTALNHNINSDARSRLAPPPTAEQIDALRGRPLSSGNRHGTFRHGTAHQVFDHNLPGEPGSATMRGTRNPPQGLHRPQRFNANTNSELRYHPTNNGPSRMAGSSHRPYPSHRYQGDSPSQVHRNHQGPVPPQYRDMPHTLQRFLRETTGFDDDGRRFGAPPPWLAMEDRVLEEERMMEEEIRRSRGGYGPRMPPGAPNRSGNGRSTGNSMHGYRPNLTEAEMMISNGGFRRAGGHHGYGNRGVGMERDSARSEGAMGGNREFGRRDSNSGGWPGDDIARYRNSRRRTIPAGNAARSRLNPHAFQNDGPRMEDGPRFVQEALRTLFDEVFTMPNGRPENSQSFRVAMGASPAQSFHRMAHWLFRNAHASDGTTGDDYEHFVDLIERMGGAGNRGATDTEIAALKTDKVKKKDSQAGSSEEDDKCAICLGEYEEGEEVKTLPCGHVFHGECIGRWLKVNRVCPFCKKSIRDRDNNDANAGSS